MSGFSAHVNILWIVYSICEEMCDVGYVCP